MAEKKPLVLYEDGRIKVLQPGDSLPANISEIDGGFAASVYLPVTQEVDGGAA